MYDTQTDVRQNTCNTSNNMCDITHARHPDRCARTHIKNDVRHDTCNTSHNTRDITHMRHQERCATKHITKDVLHNKNVLYMKHIKKDVIHIHSDVFFLHKVLCSTSFWMYYVAHLSWCCTCIMSRIFCDVLHVFCRTSFLVSYMCSVAHIV